MGGCNQAVDRRAVGGDVGGYRKSGSICKENPRKADDGDAKRSKVSPKPGADAMRVVGAESGDSTLHNGFFGKDDLVFGIDGIDERGVERLADAHGKVVVDLEREWGSGGERNGWNLA